MDFLVDRSCFMTWFSWEICFCRDSLGSIDCFDCLLILHLLAVKLFSQSHLLLAHETEHIQNLKMDFQYSHTARQTLGSTVLYLHHDRISSLLLQVRVALGNGNLGFLRRLLAIRA